MGKYGTVVLAVLVVLVVLLVLVVLVVLIAVIVLTLIVVCLSAARFLVPGPKHWCPSSPT